MGEDPNNNAAQRRPPLTFLR